jgi:hypothetical protein
MESRKLCVLVFTILLNLAPILALAPMVQKIPSHGSIVPVLRGWGGSRIHESSRISGEWTPVRTEPFSEVFDGKVASDLEMTVRLILYRGYNSIRVVFDGPVEWSSSTAGPEWQWNETYFNRTLEICKHYGIWMIVCYAGAGSDPYRHTDEWIAFWQNLVQKYGPQYEKMVWEPINEPLQPGDRNPPLVGQAAVDELGQIYQRWIEMCRSSGDNHWIVVSCVCYMNSLPEEDWWPKVTDPLEKTFLGRHHYLFYSSAVPWTIARAQARADYDFQVDKAALTKYGKPFLSTEFGATTGGDDAPDQVYVNGYTGYSNTSLAFVQRLMENYESENMRYTLFPCSDVYPPRLYGDINIWGQLLTHVSVSHRAIFSDGFESNDFSPWYGTVGSPSLQSAMKHHGNYAMQCDTSFPQKASTKFVQQSVVYTRIYIYFPCLPTNGKSLSFLEHYDWTVGINDFVVGVRNDSEMVKWSVNRPWTLASSGPVAGRWYCVEFKTTLSDNTTSWEVWVDGSSVLTGNYTGTSDQYDTVLVGNWDKSEALTSYIDCVIVDNTYIGPEEPNTS